MLLDAVRLPGVLTEACAAKAARRAPSGRIRRGKMWAAARNFSARRSKVSTLIRNREGIQTDRRPQHLGVRDLASTDKSQSGCACAEPPSRPSAPRRQRPRTGDATSTAGVSRLYSSPRRALAEACVAIGCLQERLGDAVGGVAMATVGHRPEYWLGIRTHVLEGGHR